tara:strand:- start:64 stop:1053 length:990 start_codon:yes stop_codon:yes gene_type:complete
MKHELKIGRDASNHIIIDDPSISRNHALLSVTGDSYKIRDLDSLNGTFINGIRIRGEAALVSDDILKLGSQLIPWMSYVDSADNSELSDDNDKVQAISNEATTSSNVEEVERIEKKGVLKDNEERSKWAIYLIAAILILDIITLVSDYAQHELLQNFKSGILASDSTIDANDNRVMTIAIIQFIAGVISAITFIMWFRRAYFNLHQLTDDLKYKEGMAAGCWFIPFVNLFRPFEIMREMFTTSLIIVKKHGVRNEEQSKSNLVGLWWTSWIILALINQVIFRTKENTIDDYLFVSNLNLISDLVAIFLALVTMSMINKYSKIEKSLATL